MTDIETILNKAAREIKEILIREANKLQPFPTIEVATRTNNPEHRTYNIRGIIVAYSELDNYVIMTSQGLYSCEEAVIDSKRKTVAPDWLIRVEHPEIYIKYGRMALNSINSSLKLDKLTH